MNLKKLNEQMEESISILEDKTEEMKKKLAVRYGKLQMKVNRLTDMEWKCGEELEKIKKIAERYKISEIEVDGGTIDLSDVYLGDMKA